MPVIEFVSVTRHRLCLHHHWHVEVGCESASHPRKLRRRDANHGEAKTVQLDGSIDERRLAAETPLPQSMTDDNDRTSARCLVFFRQKQATFCRSHTQYIEIIASNNGAAKPFRL